LKANRKEFIKITGLGLGGFLFNPSLSEAFTTSNDIGGFCLKRGRIFLNNGTMGPSPKVVSKAIKDRMDYVNETASYGGLESATLARVAKFLGVESDEIALTHNVTEGINIAAWSIPLKRGDQVLMTGHEHVGGALPWLNRQKIDGIKVKTFDLQETAAKTLEEVSAAINSKTRVIAVPHIPCTIGQVLPIKEIVELAKSKNILTVIDGAHPTGMMPLNLRELGCDIYVSCFHKWLCGPKGTGYMFVSNGIRQILKPMFVGAHSADWKLDKKQMELTHYVESAHQYFYGTQNTALYAGIIAAMDFQDEIGRDKIYAHGKSLANYFKEYLLSNAKTYDLLTPQEEQSSACIISFKFGEKGKMLTSYLRKNNIVTRFVAESDLFCNRISFHMYNSKAQVDELIKHMEEFH